MRAAGRDIESGLRQLLNEWDPIGVADEARDEYDCMLAPLLQRLRRRADEVEISDFLRYELEDHFTLDPRLSDPERMAAGLTSWWAATGQGHRARRQRPGRSGRHSYRTSGSRSSLRRPSVHSAATKPCRS